MNSMHAMCRALGLEEALKKERLASGDAADGADDDCAYQDVTQPLEVIARRLFNYKAMVESDANAELRRRRILEATFIVEFGLAFGLPDRSDRTADEMLVEFLERVREWGGNNTESAKLLLETLPPGPAHQSLRKVLTDWLEENKTWVVRGGAVLGVIGVIAASIAVAHATSDRRSPANGHGQHLSGHGRRNGGA
uniref:Uncharacterized protein n=2 Tax=Chrysotila carterae TaxID=13221 RepID=A0A7S4BLY1_CHRCT